MSRRGSGASHGSNASFLNALSPKSRGSNSSSNSSSPKKVKYKHSRSLASTSSSQKGLLPGVNEKVSEHSAPDVSKLRVAFSETRHAVSDDKSMGLKTTFQSVAQNLSKSIRKVNIGRGFLDVLRSKDFDDTHEETDVNNSLEQLLVETAPPSSTSSKPRGKSLFRSKALLVARTTFAFRNKAGGAENEIKIDGHMAPRRKSVVPMPIEERICNDSDTCDAHDDSSKSESSSRSSTKPDSNLDAWIKIAGGTGHIHEADEDLGLTLTSANLGKRFSLTNVVVPILRTPDPTSGRVLENGSFRNEPKMTSTEREAIANMELQNPTVFEADTILVADPSASRDQDTHARSKFPTSHIHQISHCIDVVDIGLGQHDSSQENAGGIDEIASGLGDDLKLQQQVDGIEDIDDFYAQFGMNATRELLRTQLGSSMSCDLERTRTSSSRNAFRLDDRLHRFLDLPSLSSRGAKERACLLGRRAFVDESLLENEILQASTQRSQPSVTVLRSFPSFRIPFTTPTISEPPRLLTPQRAQGRSCFKREADIRSTNRLQADVTKPRRLDMIADNACIWKRHCKDAGISKRSESGGVYQANVVRSAFAHRGFVDTKTAPKKSVPWRGKVELNIWGWEASDLWEASDVTCMVPGVPSLQAGPDGFDTKSLVGQPLRFGVDSSCGSEESIDLEAELLALDLHSNEGGDSFLGKSSRNSRSISAMLGL